MANGKQRQALAISARLSPHGNLPGIPGGSFAALENEAKRMAESDAETRAASGTSGHIVIDAGRLSGFVKDAHTTVRFAGGSVAVTTHD
jgi:hypothetical protein